MKIKKLALVLLMMLGLAVATEAIEELTFQGRLTGSDGNPLNGSKKMSFILYRVAKGEEFPLFEWFSGDKGQITSFYVDSPYNQFPATGENARYAKVNGGGSVPVYKGIYAVRLPFNQPILKYALEHEDTLYIEVRVEGANNQYETLSPRVKVASSMFAMMANQVKWAKAKGKNNTTGLSYDVSKNNNEITFVGIGCEPADNVKLKIQGVTKNGSITTPVTALQVVGTANIDELKVKNITVEKGLEITSINIGLTKINKDGIQAKKLEIVDESSSTTVVKMDSEGISTNKACSFGGISFSTDQKITKVSEITGSGSSSKISGFSSITATQVFNAVWNDLAEFRPLAAGSKKIAGRAYLSTAKGLVLPTKRCQQGVIGICSDTYGFSLGGKPEDKDKLPIAISGWVLAYVDKAYPIGTALVNGKDGILTKATFWEKTKYPERILAVVDMGPAEYNNLKVDGRTWVKVK